MESPCGMGFRSSAPLCAVSDDTWVNWFRFEQSSTCLVFLEFSRGLVDTHRCFSFLAVTSPALCLSASHSLLSFRCRLCICLVSIYICTCTLVLATAKDTHIDKVR